MKPIFRTVVLLTVAASVSHAAETTVLPQGAFLLDVAYLHSTIDKQWNGDRKAVSLLEDVRRYEPGAGLQGILHARPSAEYHVLLMQLYYGILDRLTAIINIPLVISTTINANLSWEPGDFQSQLGRSYSEDDFWAWAGSLGQPRVPQTWTGNKFTLSDMVIAARYLIPELEWMKENHMRWSATLQVALPTGKNFDPEEPVSSGTNLWELNAAGDVELHLAADKQFFVDEKDIARLNVGLDLFGSYWRPREYIAGTGKTNPLLTNIAPYVGEKYIVDPGEWLGAALSIDAVPFIGPSRASIVSGHSEEKAERLPPMITLGVKYIYIATAQSDWRSLSPLWDWDKEKLWQPGDKNIFRFNATVSLLRVGLPLQIYAQYQAADIIPGRYTRPANVLSVGMRLLAKFW